MRIYVVVASLLFLAVGCAAESSGGDGGALDATRGAADGGAAEDASAAEDAGAAEMDAGAAGMDAGSDAGVGDDAGADRSVTLQVTPVAGDLTIPDGRVIVLWLQLDDADPDPPLEIGYDGPFDGSAPELSIPLDAIAPPSPENRACLRDCADESACPCLGTPAVGIGYVLVLTDPNENGAIDLPMELESPDNAARRIGVGYLVVGQSETEHIPTPAGFETLFLDGILAGTHAYEARPRESNPALDSLQIPGDETVLELRVCEPLTGETDPTVLSDSCRMLRGVRLSL